MQPRFLPLVIIAAIGVALSVALVIIGFPETTGAQVFALSISALPLSVSVAAGDLILLQRAERTPTPPARTALIAGGVVSGIGLVVMLAALVANATAVVQFGQFVIFAGLLVVLLIAISLQGPAKTEWFRLEEVATVIDEADSSDDQDKDARPDAAEPGASL